jgi:peptide-methionine (S)-S-oxide reductase
MKRFSIALSALMVLLIVGSSCGQKSKGEKTTTVTETKPGMELATFGSGCFWCTEAIFLNVNGVEKVESGYSGGKVKNPTYREVCSGLTGHAEVIQVTYDPKVVSYDELLEIFWQTHDPTTLNRQGADEGTQ